MPARIATATLAMTGITALCLQLFLTWSRNSGGLLAVVVEFLGFFTNLSVLAVTLTSLAALGLRFPLASVFGRPSSQAAAALYIFVTMLIYHLILASQWNPQGLVLFTTTLLHTIIPLACLTWWILRADKSGLNFSHPPKWLAFPVGFLAFTLIRGALTGFYPYSFLDAGKIGYGAVLLNGAGIAILFLLAGYVMVLGARLQMRGRRLA